MPDWIPASTEVVEAEQVSEMTAQLAGAEATIDHLRESLADVQLAMEDEGWQRLGMWGDHAFTREGLAQSARLCRVMAIANPLIRRGLSLRGSYVWSGGVEIAARATGDSATGEQNVNTVVQDFLDDRGVREVLTGAVAREENERALGTDGNLLFALFTVPRTGRVQPRELPFDEVVDKITNPEDTTEVWFYKRIYSTPDGGTTTVYYPDIDYRPRRRTVRLDMLQAHEPGEIMWDAPVIHLKVNGLKGWKFGIGDAFTAISWARMYQDFLTDWGKLMHSLSRFAWRLTSDRKSKAQSAAAKINANADGEGTAAGSTAAMAGVSLEAIPKSGATIDSESGKPIAAMVAASMDVPVTMLLTDPGQTGARAVAQTLDTPTENMASTRRDAWGDFYRRLLGYVIDSAVKAPQGPLTGTVTRDEWDREVVDLGEETTRTVDVDWPDLSEADPKTLMEAIEIADGLDKLPPLLIVHLVMKALGVQDADEWLAEVTDEETGDFVPPDASAGQAAIDAFRRGQDPAPPVR